jgi:tellurite resistance protein TerC
LIETSKGGTLAPSQHPAAVGVRCVATGRAAGALRTRIAGKDVPVDWSSLLIAQDFLGKPGWMWLSFVAIVVALLAFDLGVLHRDDRAIGIRESIVLSFGYIAMALAYGGWIWWQLGPASGMEYLTGFMIEKSLALDNVFVIAMIFGYFAIPPAYQYRVLFWGILGVIVLRAIMIGLGAALISRFDWVMWIFGGFLILTGLKMLWMVDQKPDLDRNPLIGFLRRHLRVTPEIHGNRFFVTAPRDATPAAPLVRWATPLFLALVMIEFVDLVFAVDSVPAIFAITQDPFIVYTSNIFAILGLRALYFALAATIERFHYLKYALALILVFVGGKIFWAQVHGKVEPLVSLGVTALLLGGGMAYSLWRTRSGHDPAQA